MDAAADATPTTPRKKVLALDPRVREEVCDHAHVRWSGRMPCTGVLICTMCGGRGDELAR
jgi:hypothetical protein